MDEKLTWCEHVQYIKHEIAKGNGIISKARRLLNNDMLCTLYHCFVYSYSNYCIEVWGDTFKTHLQTLVKLQKKVLRIIIILDGIHLLTIRINITLSCS